MVYVYLMYMHVCENIHVSDKEDTMHPALTLTAFSPLSQHLPLNMELGWQLAKPQQSSCIHPHQHWGYSCSCGLAQIFFCRCWDFLLPGYCHGVNGWVSCGVWVCCECTSFCMIASLLIDIWVVSRLGPLWTQPLWTFLHEFSVNGRLTLSGTDTQKLVACSIFGFVVKVAEVSLLDWPFHFISIPTVSFPASALTPLVRAPFPSLLPLWCAVLS